MVNMSAPGELVNSSSEDDISDSLSLGNVLAIYLIYGPIILVTILGNTLVIVAFARDPAIRCRVSNWFIVSLSVADMLVGYSLVLNFIWLLSEDWPFGKIPCMVWLIVDYTLSYVSALMVILISLDRYRLVKLKLKYCMVQTRRRAVVSIACCWCYCLILYVVIVFAWTPITGIQNIDYTENCHLEAAVNTYMNMFLILIEFLIPLIALVCLNVQLYTTIRMRSKGLLKKEPRAKTPTVPSLSGGVAAFPRAKSRGDKASGVMYLESGLPSVSLTMWSYVAPDGDTDGKGEEIGTEAPAPTKESSTSQREKPDGHRPNGTSAHNSTTNRRLELNRHRKAAVTLSLLVGVFILCWCPFYIKTTVLTFCDDCINFYVSEITDNLLWCNSTINPFLYALLNLRFRRYFVSVFRRIFCCD